MTIEDPTPKRYHYAAKVLAAHDGDTVTLELDLGLWIRRIEKLRLHGIDTPEVVGAGKAAGLKAKAALIRLLAGLVPTPVADAAAPLPSEIGGDLRDLDIECMVQTFKDAPDKFGRLLARIFVRRPAGDAPSGAEWICVNDELIALGYAKPWNGQGARP